MPRALWTLLALPLLAPVPACSKKDEPRPAPVASVVKPPTPPAGPDEVVDCAGAECSLKRVSDSGKEKLERQPSYQELTVVFRKGATNDDLKTLARVPWVTHLRIDSEEITDTFGLTDLAGLKKLEIGGSRIKSLAGVARLSGLAHFDAKNLATLDDVTALAQHPHLTELTLAGTGVSDIKPLWSTNELLTLDLRGTAVEDLAPLQKATKLESLDLTDTKVKDLQPLSEAKELKKLLLANTPIESVDPLKSLQKVETLDLSGTKVRGLDGLREMKRLQTLNLAGAKNVSDFKSLVRCTQIVVLDASRTNVVEVMPLVVMKRMKVLHLTGTRIRDVMALSAVSDLEELFLQGTYVQDLAPLAGLKKLKRIVVGKTFPKAKIEAFKKLSPKVDVTQEAT